MIMFSSLYIEFTTVYYEMHFAFQFYYMKKTKAQNNLTDQCTSVFVYTGFPTCKTPFCF